MKHWQRLCAMLLLLVSFLWVGCIASSPSEQTDKDAGDASAPDTSKAPLTFKVLTFNIGTTKGLDHDKGEKDGKGDGYTNKMAQIADELYENSLSWNPAEKALTAFLAKHKPDIAGFQEGFYDPWCEHIKVDPALDFVCKGYHKNRPLQIQRILGSDYQVACADGQEDNCIGVKKSFGTIVGCDPNKPCIKGLKGKGPTNGCSRGARMASAQIRLTSGDVMTVVLIHGTSGVTKKDQACRAEQFKQIFEDKGDGKPHASGKVNLLLGDLNVDPFVMTDDPSARIWNKYVGQGKAYRFISSDAKDGPRTYGRLFRIDHVASDKLSGHCVVPGMTKGWPAVLDAVYWDHKPLLCTVRWPSQ